MPRVGIVTDSTNCLPPELIKEYGIRVVPVAMVANGRLYRDGIDLTLEQFWKMFPSLEEQPTTAAGNPGDFVTVFSELARTCEGVVCILVSKSLTATFESAYLARRLVKAEFPNVAIEVLDSRTSGGALGFIVLEAARAASQNAGMDEVIQVIEDMTSRVVYLAAVETLQYMIKIGRAPKNAGIGEWLGVKPLIGFVDDSGYVDVVGRVTGKEKAVQKIVDLVKKYVDTKQPLHVMVHYSNSRKDAEEMLGLVKARYKCTESFISEYSPVMCAATGPMIGIGFYT